MLRVLSSNYLYGFIFVQEIRFLHVVKKRFILQDQNLTVKPQLTI